MCNNYVKMLIDIDDLKKIKSREKAPLECKHCSTIFFLEKKHIQCVIKGKSKSKYDFCSRECFSLSQRKRSLKKCVNCEKKFERNDCEINKRKNHFCSLSCNAKYYNKNKTFGSPRSKIEIWLENEMCKKYPNLEITFNDRKTIGLELDIYIKKLSLAFEINGITHYEPIYGNDKFQKTKNKDMEKIFLCEKLNISLHILNVSKQQKFSPKDSVHFLEKIISEINFKINKIGG